MTGMRKAAPPLTKIREPATLTALLVWTYARQKADIVSGKGLWTPKRIAKAEPEPVQQWSGCGCAQLAEVAALGARIEKGGWQRPAVHPDAELVHDLLVEQSKTDWAGAMLLLRYGRQGGTPEWSDGRQEFEPVYDDRDRVIQDRYDEVALVIDGRGRERAVPVLYCPVRPYPDDAWVQMTRGEYRLWHGSLRRLADSLANPPLDKRLIRWALTGLGAAAEPWIS
ncbi:MAG TPA: hypothetical protein VGG27_14975 [Magnetospirillaceae bacterium]|jgi:hypothetical protein